MSNIFYKVWGTPKEKLKYDLNSELRLKSSIDNKEYNELIKDLIKWRKIFSPKNAITILFVLWCINAIVFFYSKMYTSTFSFSSISILFLFLVVIMMQLNEYNLCYNACIDLILIKIESDNNINNHDKENIKEALINLRR